MPLWLADLCERAGWTFIQGFTAAVLATTGEPNVTALKVGAIAGGLAVLKWLSVEATQRLRPDR